ncbi:hypothetical protein [Psychrobacter sp. bablab_jr012]|uniref:hypothetical protein n=1 Tax=Psychrobacter sp. bablab_jr012 TaxID=2755061 RepID=UPI0018F70BC4|nr:hypothetical protein [Psychrobacter sp. bablab_jr012]
MHPSNSNSQSQRWLSTSDAQIVTRVIEIDNHLLAAIDKTPRIKRGRDAKFLAKIAKRQPIIKE